jgi:hypothetical protein
MKVNYPDTKTGLPELKLVDPACLANSEAATNEANSVAPQKNDAPTK